MERFFLLRKNQESGPYTLRELKEKNLCVNDLLWQDGESTCWKHPAEIPLLQGLPLAPAGPTISRAENIQKSTAPDTKVYSASTAERPKTAVIDAELATPCFEELKLKYGQRAPRKKAWRKGLNIGANLVGLATFVIGVMVTAFMVKKAIDNIELEPMVATAETEEISSETLPVSTTQHAAFSLVKPSVETPVEPIVPAVEKKIAAIAPKALTPGTQEQESSKAATTGMVAEAAAPAQTETAPAAAVVVPAAVKEDVKEEIAKGIDKEDKRAVKPALRLSANQFSVGFLGGISNLELSVSNPTAVAVSKAVVEVEYLKPNGKSAGSKTVVVSGLAAGSSKKVQVPDHGRGVNVRYRVVETE